MSNVTNPAANQQQRTADPGGETMEIPTGEFRALRAEVDGLRTEVDQITRHLHAQDELTELLHNTRPLPQLREVTAQGGRTAQILYLHPAGGDTA